MMNPSKTDLNIMKKKSFIIASALLAIPFGIGAQTADNDTINRTVLVESVYNPVLSSSEKRSFLPEEEPVTTVRETVTYSENYLEPTVWKREPFAPGSMQLTPSGPRYGYARLGYGTFNVVDAEGVAHFALGQNDGIDVGISGEGWKGKVPYGDDRWDGHQRSIDARVNYIHTGNTSVCASLDFGTYGHNYIANDSLSSRLTTSPLAFSYGAQVSVNGDISDFSIDQPIEYTLRTGFHQWRNNCWQGFEQLNTEGHFEADLLLAYRLNANSHLRLNLHDDLLSYQLPGYDTYDAFTATPQWTSTGDNWTAAVGLNVDIQTRGGSFLQLSPACHFTYTAFDRIRLDLAVDGGRDLHTFADLYALSPYWMSLAQLSQPYNFLNARLHADARVMDGIHVGLKGGYRIIDNALFFSEDFTKGILFSRLDNHDAKVMTLGADASYAFTDYIRATADLTLYKWDVGSDNLSLLAYAPKADANVNIRFTLLDNLHINGGIRYILRNETAAGRVPSVFDVSAGADYAFNDRFSVYVKFDNLLSQRYSLYPGYPALGIHGLAGIIFKL